MSKLQVSATDGILGSLPPDERRRRQRLKLSLPVRVQPLDPEPKQLEEVVNTLNFNRNGVCFTTWLSHYYVGMHLVLTIPYSSATSVRKEYPGEVVRLEHFPSGCYGIAVRFFS